MWSDLVLFAAAFAISASMPGPDTLLLFSRALSSGASSAVPLAVGLTLGKLALLTAAIAGVTAAAAALGPFFVIVKLAGGAYLVWLAVRLWRRAGQAATAGHTVDRVRATAARRGWRGVGLGAVLTLSNPQALLFYVAVLPTVLDSSRVTVQEYLLLCLVLALVMALVAAGYISLGLRTRSALTGSRRRLAERAGAVLLGVTGAFVVSR